MLEHECQELDLLMATEDEEAEHTKFQQELATMLKHAQKLEGEAGEQVELAEQHQTVHDYFSATAEPSEGHELDPLDLQLAELLRHIKALHGHFAVGRYHWEKLYPYTLKPCRQPFLAKPSTVHTHDI